MDISHTHHNHTVDILVLTFEGGAGMGNLSDNPSLRSMLCNHPLSNKINYMSKSIL